jgi:hypothetical protein
MRLNEGDFFGEIALLSGKPRQATVKANGKVSVLVIGRDAFTRLCGNLVDILQRGMSSYSCAELPLDNSEGIRLSICDLTLQSLRFFRSSTHNPIGSRGGGAPRANAIFIGHASC